jgi:glutathione peroxidase
MCRTRFNRTNKQQDLLAATHTGSPCNNALVAKPASNGFCSEDSNMTTFHQLTATSLRGQLIPMADYAGKLVLVVNTASHCGFTPQYAGLETLYKKYAAQGLVVLGFPCNQFGKQEPGGADDIAQTCHINYGVSFPMFEKVEVNGAATHPVFRYLKDELPGVLGGRIKWNFTKFLIGRDGKPLKRFAPISTPEKMEAAILAALEIDVSL